MEITAEMVKQLRAMTGAGMMECKKSLSSAEGDMERAVELLRKSGQAKANKKSGRIAAEGTISINFGKNNDIAILLEVNCETDFVAKDKQFRGFCDAVSNTILTDSVSDMKSLTASDYADKTIEVAKQELVTKLGENIQVRRFEKVQRRGDLFGSYLHGTRIGVLVDMKGGSDELAKDVAMHIAASHPVCVSEQDVPSEMLEKERNFLSEQAKESGKPAELIDKIVSGRLNKYLKEITLLGQAFVKNPDQTVEQLLKEHSASVLSFIRYELGEGIERKQENFAEEVMAQISSA